MLRFISLLVLLPLLLGASASIAQTKKPSGAKVPTDKDSSITVNVFMRDARKNELLLATRIWPGYPDYDALVLQRYFAAMKMLEPEYKQDDEVAYTWSNKDKVTKCSIYLESADAGVRNGTGAIVGCEANGVSSVPVPSESDPRHGPSASSSPKHLNDVMELFKHQSERARNTLPKK